MSGTAMDYLHERPLIWLISLGRNSMATLHLLVAHMQKEAFILILIHRYMINIYLPKCYCYYIDTIAIQLK